MKRLGAFAAATMLAGIAAAQTVSDPQAGAGQDTPATNLNLPSNLQVFGKVDPNIRKATAIVNETVITGTDVDQRLAMITGLRGVQVSDAERDQLRLQVLRAIIDETLQIQAAANEDIKVAPAEIEQSFTRVSRNFQRTPEQMKAFLEQIGSSERSLRRQIEGELAWTRLLRRQVEPFISVGEEEVKAIIARLEAAKGTEEAHLKEIYLSATPDRAAEVLENGRKMIEQMRGGAPFEYFARNFSEATTKAVEGDLGWINPAVLPDQLAAAAKTMQVGQIAGPIAIPGGYSILYMVDKRQVLTADPRDARLSLRQMSVKFSTALTQEQIQARAAEFAQVTQKIQGCGNVNAVAQQIGAEVVDNDAIRIRELPAQLQDLMINLQVGQATPPFGSPTEGVRVLVLCGRDDPATANAPNPEQIQAGLEQERVNLRAQRMLRDLRRDAIVEYQ
ncbi:peptidylprolyl isomerase [Sphingomonas sp. S1-29]|uniref:peptidylprolyl isomerase n=1 Tax=Sphingomonas sp. S1-29 TaxID=2991074 RepID=UPI00223F9FF5|nr:peptidylprolyl isomerase [Sphingomonas sp. S1-29]UZK69972.1 peptidylprolyl isomerase [Sphingomonas sp. S1-29]